MGAGKPVLSGRHSHCIGGDFFRVYIPGNITHKIGADSVGTILHIIASSMLAVTTFSLSTVVAAYSAAVPARRRARHSCCSKIRRAQNALSTFIGSFLYSLVGIIALQIGVYGDAGASDPVLSSLLE